MVPFRNTVEHKWNTVMGGSFFAPAGQEAAPRVMWIRCHALIIVRVFGKCKGAIWPRILDDGSIANVSLIRGASIGWSG